MYWDFVASGVSPMRSAFAMLPRAVGPVRLDGIPELLQPLLVRVAILHDQDGHFFRMCKSQWIADRCTVILHIEAILFSPIASVI